MSFLIMILIVTILLETFFAFMAVQGIRRKRVWIIIVFAAAFFVVPFLIFYGTIYGISLM